MSIRYFVTDDSCFPLDVESISITCDDVDCSEWTYHDKNEAMNALLSLSGFTLADIRELMFCSFRYALGRMTYIVPSICDILKENVDKLDECHKVLMIKEITAAIEKNDAGMNCDKREWESVLKVLRGS